MEGRFRPLDHQCISALLVGSITLLRISGCVGRGYVVGLCLASRSPSGVFPTKCMCGPAPGHTHIRLSTGTPPPRSGAGLVPDPSGVMVEIFEDAAQPPRPATHPGGRAMGHPPRIGGRVDWRDRRCTMRGARIRPQAIRVQRDPPLDPNHTPVGFLASSFLNRQPSRSHFITDA